MKVSVWIAALSVVLVVGCQEVEETTEPPIRGLRTVVVEGLQQEVVRRYPSVLEPSQITSLSFEIGGKLGEIDLTVGQRISQGDLLAEIDPEQYETEIERLRAAVREASALFNQAKEDLERNETLLKKGVVTRVTRDNSRTDFRAKQEQLTQAQQELKSAQEDLGDTSLIAPFSGIVNSVDVDSFATVGVGDSILSVYDPNAFEVSITVSFDVVEDLVVGTPATVRLADDPDITLNAVVSELGERADTVSSFPVIVTLTENHPILKAGMATEISFAFKLPVERGFLLPITAPIPDQTIARTVGGANAVRTFDVFVFDPSSSTVQRREVVMAGIRDNMLLVIDGLMPGERVASAGVSYLRDGMAVHLLPDSE